MSPEVWSDVKPRIQVVATAQGFTVAWPNEDFKRPDGYTRPDGMPEDAAPWLAVEFASSSDSPIELGAGTWQEDGSVWLHIMLPRLSGIDTGLAIKDALSVAFRTNPPTLAGLVYRGDGGSPGQSLDPVTDSIDDGVYVRLTLAVRYIFQSRIAP